MKIQNRSTFIEAGDEYFDNVNYVWRPVPVFWYGSNVEHFNFSIRENPFAKPQPVKPTRKNENQK